MEIAHANLQLKLARVEQSKNVFAFLLVAELVRDGVS